MCAGFHFREFPLEKLHRPLFIGFAGRDANLPAVRIVLNPPCTSSLKNSACAAFSLSAHRAPSFCFRGRPPSLPPFLAHLLRVFLSYFAARALPPLLASS